MTSIDEKRKLRLKYMNTVFEITGGSRSKIFNTLQVGSSIGLDMDATRDIVQYLKDEYLIEFYAIGGLMRLTHKGIVEMEQSLSKPEAPTEHFPPFSTINYNINVENMINSQIIQASPNATQTNNVDQTNLQELKEIIEMLKKIVVDTTLEVDKKNELQAEIQTVQSQLNSPRPKIKIITEGLASVRTILESVSTVPVAFQVLSKIADWLSKMT